MLAVDLGRGLEFGKRLAADMAVVRHLLDLQHPAVGGKANLAQGGQVFEEAAHPEVIGVVDRGFGSQRPTFFMVLLEVGVFVIDVQGGHDARGNNARPTSAVVGSLSSHGAGKDQLHLIGTAQINVLADDLLEETAPVQTLFPDLGQGELRLKFGQNVTVTGPAILGTVGRREAGEPFAEESLNLGRAQALANPLGCGEVGATQQAIVQGLEGDAALGASDDN